MVHFRAFGVASACALVVAGCTALYDYPAVDGENTAAACANGADDDFDGLTDCHDSDCASFCAELGVSLCHDGLDNDFNGKTDCAEATCSDSCKEDTLETCSDGRDDDADGLADCFDPGCAEFCAEGDATTCGDGKDNDVDGLVDCADTDCQAQCPEGSADTCADQQDNDTDGLVDCADPNCDGFCTEQSPADCSDNRDNDGDGLKDGADPRCWTVGPLDVQNCASRDATFLSNGFDISDVNGVSFSNWETFGDSPNGSAAKFTSSWDRPDRADNVGFFEVDVARPPEGLYWYSADAGFVSADTLSGAWAGFRLDFSARVVEHSRLRVALLPAALAPSGKPPTGDVEAILVGVYLDGRSSPPVLELDAAGKHVAVPFELPPGAAICQSPLGTTYCDGGWYRVAVRIEGAELVARLSGAASAEVRAPVPPQQRVPATRVVIRGSSAGLQYAPSATTYVARYDSLVDDLVVQLGGETACGGFVPQLPFGDAPLCEGPSRGVTTDTGHTVAVSRSSDGRYCALVTAGAARGVASTVGSWRSTDGKTWRGPTAPVTAVDGGADAATPNDAASDATSADAASADAAGADAASSDAAADAPLDAGADAAPESGSDGGSPAGTGLKVPAGHAVDGAGVAWDETAQRFRAVVSWRDSVTVHLGVASSTDCEIWSDLAPAPDLPSSAEAPSYLVRDASPRHELWYTRPPNDVTGRTLWRLTSDDGVTFVADASPATEFSAQDFVGAPVALSRVGKTDVVLTYRILASAGAQGLGVLVANEPSLGSFTRTVTWPMLQPSGDVATFDGEETLSGAIGWGVGSQGFLLYGARGLRFSPPTLFGAEPWKPATAGTALLRGGGKVILGSLDGGTGGADAASGDAGSAKAAVECGDGTCDSGESCATCEVDCSCGASTLLQERAESNQGWIRAPVTGTSVGIDSLSGVARVFGYGLLNWLTHPLPNALSGDFEVEFTVAAPAVDYCGLRVGLTPEFSSGAPQDGVFVDLSGPRPCLVPGGGGGSLVPAATPLVLRAGNQLFENSADCDNVPLLRLQSALRVVLRRQHGAVSVRVLGADGCELPKQGDASTRYDGALPAFDRLVVGTSGCTGSVSTLLDNFVVRSLGDPGSCPTGTLACGGGCVDTQTSGEHCGGCDQPCDAARHCAGGTCSCSGGLDTCPSGCTHLSSDPENCGTCGHACAAALGEECIAGACVTLESCANPYKLPPDGGSVTVDLVGHQVDDPGACGSGPGGPAIDDVALHWVPSKTGLVTAFFGFAQPPTPGSAPLASVGVYPSAACDDPSLLCRAADPYAPPLPLSLPVTAGVPLWIRLILMQNGPPPSSAKVSFSVAYQ